MNARIFRLLTALTVAIMILSCGFNSETESYKTVISDNQNVDVGTPLKAFSSDEGVSALAGGSFYSFIIASNDYLYAAGDNSSGQFGIENKYSSRALI